MQPFKITAELKSPIMVGPYTFTTLDAVCFGIIEELGRNGIEARSVPIASEDGLYLASRAFFDGAVHSEAFRIGGIRVVKDMQEASQFIDPVRKTMSKVITHRGPYKSFMSKYDEISARSVSWYAVGDAEKITALLTSAGCIGAIRKDGYGRLGEIEIDFDVDEDVWKVDGKLSRPIPVEHPLAQEFRSEALVYETAWRPPYYDRSNFAVCVAPA